MTNGINTRELILQILLEIEEEGKHSHIAIRNALSKYQFLPRQERAFITRVCEGTLEYRILIDYIIDSYSKVSVDKMKPVIREILRSAVYQIRFMDSVPDKIGRAHCICSASIHISQILFIQNTFSMSSVIMNHCYITFICQIFHAGNTGKPLA